MSTKAPPRSITQRKEQERTERRTRLLARYARLPTVECKGLCEDECTVIGFDGVEQEYVADAGLELPVLRPRPDLGEGQNRCSWLEGGRCTHYAHRPWICRIYGGTEHAEELRGVVCPHGCKVTGTLLSVDDTLGLSAAFGIIKPTVTYLSGMSEHFESVIKAGMDYWWPDNETNRHKRLPPYVVRNMRLVLSDNLNP